MLICVMKTNNTELLDGNCKIFKSKAQKNSIKFFVQQKRPIIIYAFHCKFFLLFQFIFHIGQLVGKYCLQHTNCINMLSIYSMHSKAQLLIQHNSTKLQLQARIQYRSQITRKAISEACKTLMHVGCLKVIVVKVSGILW